jgi:Putative addiction module component
MLKYTNEKGGCMSIALDTIEAEVMNLSASKRSYLLDRLTVSLKDDATIQTAWAAEAVRRDAQIESGEVEPIPGDVVFAKLFAKLK